MIGQLLELKNLRFIKKIAWIHGIRDNRAARPHPSARVVNCPRVGPKIVIRLFVGTMTQNRRSVYHVALGLTFLVERFRERERQAIGRRRSDIFNMKGNKFPLWVYVMQLT